MSISPQFINHLVRLCWPFRLKHFNNLESRQSSTCVFWTLLILTMALDFTCLRAVSVWRPVALATMVWLFPGLGCSDRVRPDTAWTRISVMETLSSVTEKADSPSTASMASGDSTCGRGRRRERNETRAILFLHSDWRPIGLKSATTTLLSLPSS